MASSFDIYSKEVEKYPQLTESEEKEVFKKVKEGDKNAREEAINSNLRLVVWIASHINVSSIAIDDLVQEGNIGLIKAVDNFDPDKGNKFATYAYWRIRGPMLRVIKESSKAILVDLDKAFLPGPDTPETIYEKEKKEEQKEKMSEMVASLEGREKNVITKYYGLGGEEKSQSGRIIGEGLGVSHQTVFYIKKKAEGEMRRELLGRAA